MLTIIDRYILKKYLSTFGLMLLLFVPIGIMLNLAEQIGKMIDNEAPLVEILIYYGNFTIYIGSLLFPIFLQAADTEMLFRAARRLEERVGSFGRRS